MYFSGLSGGEEGGELMLLKRIRVYWGTCDLTVILGSTQGGVEVKVRALSPPLTLHVSYFVAAAARGSGLEWRAVAIRGVGTVNALRTRHPFKLQFRAQG